MRVDALRDRPVPVNFLLACLLQAALLGAGAVMALTLTGITLAWLLFETLVQLVNREASQLRASTGVLAALAVLLGILAGAGLWLPSAPASEPATLEFRTSFLTLEGLLAAPPIHDAGAIISLRELPNLGLAQWALALAGAVAALLLYIGGYRTRHPNAFLGTVFFAGLALLLITLMQPSAAGSMERLSAFAAACARLRACWGPTAACLAIVAGMNGFWLSRISARYQSSTIAVLVASPILTVIPLLYVPPPRASLETTPALSESAGLAVGEINALGYGSGRVNRCCPGLATAQLAAHRRGPTGRRRPCRGRASSAF